VAPCLIVLAVCLSVAGCNASPAQIAVQSPEAILGVIASQTPISEVAYAAQTSATPVPSENVTSTPTAIWTPGFSPTSTTAEIEPTSAPSPYDPLQCEDDWCSYTGHFWLSRPIENDQVEPTYRYGATQNNTREEHHGIEIIDHAGTPVLAAADGIVTVAGNDLGTKYGLYRNFYGNLVILQHDLPQSDEPIFTLYAHLTYISVQEGETVTRGETIGTVGSTGAATGSHLHFEVRVGENEYNSTSNPELWLEPDFDPVARQANGALAIHLLDPNGPIYSYPVLIDRFEQKDGPILETMYAETYAWSTPNNNPWKEQVAIGNLVPGLYRVSFTRGNEYKYEFVTVFPGQLSLVEINIH
jgi:murein DD-endopeptidase MepM/ murein hydrolase activator NlpD